MLTEWDKHYRTSSADALAYGLTYALTYGLTSALTSALTYALTFALTCVPTNTPDSFSGRGRELALLFLFALDRFEARVRFTDDIHPAPPLHHLAIGVSVFCRL